MYRPPNRDGLSGRKKPARIQAKIHAGHRDVLFKSLTIDVSDSSEASHRAAAEALVSHVGRTGTPVRGKDYATGLGWDVLTNPTR